MRTSPLRWQRPLRRRQCYRMCLVWKWYPCYSTVCTPGYCTPFEVIVTMVTRHVIITWRYQILGSYVSLLIFNLGFNLVAIPLKIQNGNLSCWLPYVQRKSENVNQIRQWFCRLKRPSQKQMHLFVILHTYHYLK